LLRGAQVAPAFPHARQGGDNFPEIYRRLDFVQSVRSVGEALDICSASPSGTTRSLTQIADRCTCPKHCASPVETLEYRDSSQEINLPGCTGWDSASLNGFACPSGCRAAPLGASLSPTPLIGVWRDGGFSILDGSHVIYLEVIESPQRVKLAAASAAASRLFHGFGQSSAGVPAGRAG